MSTTPKKKPLNNSTNRGQTNGDKNQILNVYNMLNSDKENMVYNMEKNLARSLHQQPLRPALRSANHEQRVIKQIRFNLSRDSNNSENMTPTPPPKEFKRNSNRKTLRNARCMSTIVTDKERALLNQYPSITDPSPKAPSGFVRSMCRFYVDNFSNNNGVKGSDHKRNSPLNRSNSFSGQESVSSSPNESPPQDMMLLPKNRGSFRLFRSNSWSSRRKKTSSFSEENGALTSTNSSPVANNSSNDDNIDILDAEQQQRSSPSYSTKSQDSGYSENGEQLKQMTLQRVSASQLIQNQRLQFLRANMELFEDECDPNLTQVPSAASADLLCKQRNDQSNSNKSAAAAAVGRKNNSKVTESLGNIASLQVGLNIKRHMAEDFPRDQLPPPTNGALNLLRPQKHFHEKIRPKSFQESVNDLSQLSQDFHGDEPIFSTPVRASFRGRLRPRPHTVIHLEDAKTPMKREGKTRLREMKTKGRRWSGGVFEDGFINEQRQNGAYGGILAEKKGIPEEIDPSLVAVWSQFVNFESSIPALSSVVTPSMLK